MGIGFEGIELMKRAIFSHRSALHTTSHNIANANTEGYSRQRVNYAETNPLNGVSRNRLEIPGQIGTGVEIDSVERLRVQFLDFQYRNETSKVGYYQTRADALSRMEGIFNEPSNQGLSQTMNEFWQALQDLSVNPSSNGVRSVVRQRGVAVADMFNYLSDSLNQIMQDLQSQIETKVDKINRIASDINELNIEIRHLETHGYTPNDLYDKRDQLVDELSNIVEINVTTIKSSKASKANTDGVYTIEIVGDNGYPLFGNTKLVDGETHTAHPLLIQDGKNGSVGTITLGTSVIHAEDFSSVGELRALIESFGYENNAGEVDGLYPDMLNKLDSLAYTFAGAFNKVHEDGNSLYEIENGESLDIPFFSDAVDERVAKYSKETVDVVFVVDISGSMSSKLAKVAEKLPNLVSEIKEGQIKEVRFGLVKYLEEEHYESVTFPTGDIWSTETEELGNILSNMDSASGSRESLMYALKRMLPEYGKNDSFKHIIFVTDEGNHGNLSSDDIIGPFKEKGIQIHGIYNPGTYDGDVTDLVNIVDGTGGEHVDIRRDNWSVQLVDNLGSSIREYVETAGTGEYPKEGYAGRMKVSEEIIEDLSKIAAAIDNTTGNGENAIELAKVFSEKLPYHLDDALTDFDQFYQGIIGELGVLSEQSQRLRENSAGLQQTIDENRQSISAVSLDEEMANLLQYQHAFNAASRQLTAIDELLNRVINEM